MKREELKLKLDCTLRKLGLSRVPKPVLACVSVACALLIVGALSQFWPSADARTGDDFSLVSTADSTVSIEQASSTEELQEIAVDVEGAVKRPGLYRFSEGDRYADAIEAAGGFTKKASRASLNLAQKLEDGMQIVVPTKREVKAAAGSDTAQSNAAQGGAAENGVESKVNLNTATSEELQALSGIGPAMAQRIIDYREQNGGFKQIEDLQNVSGIGEARFAQLKDKVCV